MIDETDVDTGKKFRIRSHVIHGIITVFFTGGFWLPIWMTHYLAHHKKNPFKAFKDENKADPAYKKVKFGIIKFGAIAAMIFGIYVYAIISSVISSKEWQKTKDELIVQIDSASQAGDYQKALDLYNVYADKKMKFTSPDLDSAIYDALQWKAEQNEIINIRKRKELQERREKERVAKLNKDHQIIDDSVGVKRETLLLRLDKSDSLNHKYLDDITQAELADKNRKLQKKEEELKIKKFRDKLLSMKVGDVLPHEDKLMLIRSETNAELSNPKRWVAYNAKYDCSFVMTKGDESMIIQYVGGKKSAEKWVKNKDKAREQMISRGFTVFSGEHRQLKEVVKNSLHDPDSYKHIDTAYWDNGDHLIVNFKYSGTNAFGGRVKGFVKAKVSLEGEVLKILEEQ